MGNKIEKVCCCINARETMENKIEKVINIYIIINYIENNTSKL